VIHPPADVLHQKDAVRLRHGEVQVRDYIFYRSGAEHALDVEFIDDLGDSPLVIVCRSHPIETSDSETALGDYITGRKGCVLVTGILFRRIATLTKPRIPRLSIGWIRSKGDAFPVFCL